MIFKAYVNKPAVAHYDDTADERTPPLAATLKTSLEDKHIGATFRATVNGIEQAHRIINVSHVYNAKTVGDLDEHGDYRIISTDVVGQGGGAP